MTAVDTAGVEQAAAPHTGLRSDPVERTGAADTYPRICILSANLPPLYTGGGQQAITLGTALHALGHQVLFVTRRHGAVPSRDRFGPLDVYRVEFTTDRYPGFGSTIRQIYALGAQLLSLRHRFDVALYFNPEGGFHNSWILIPLLHLFGKKSAARMTLLDANDPAALRRKRFAWFRMMPYRLHHRVISISTALSVSFRSVFGDDPRLAYIPNGVDVSRYRPLDRAHREELRSALRLDPRFRYCTFVGRISHRKGIDTLIAAWADVVRLAPDARLLLVGPEFDEFRSNTQDNFSSTLRDTIAREGLQPSIIWVGRTDYPERYLQVSDVFVFPSRREGCPNALLEAMACGVPIVTTRIPDITEDLIVPEVHGLVVPQDPAALGKAVLRLLTDPELSRRLGQQALSRATTDFAIDVTARRYAEALQRL